MTRNFSSMLADCRSCSMFRRAAAWYFSSIFLEQHVEPFGIHTCRSDPRDTNKCKKLAWGGRIVASIEETYSMQWYHCNYCLGKLMTFLEFVLSKQLSQRRGLIRESQDCWAIAPESSLHTHANTMLALATSPGVLVLSRAIQSIALLPPMCPVVHWQGAADSQKRWCGRWKKGPGFEADYNE